MVKRILQIADLVVGLLLASTVAVLSALSVAKQEVVSAVILALLALILSVFFRLRNTLEEIDRESTRRGELLDNLAARFDGSTGASTSFRLDYPDFSESIDLASEVFVIAGGSLRTSVGSYLYQFRSAVKRGAHVRLCCPDPEDKGLMQQLALKQGVKPENATSGVRTNLELAFRLGSHAIVDAASGSNLEVRVTSHLPASGMFYIKSSEGDEELWVKILPHSFESGAAPAFRLDPKLDPIVFPILMESANALWDEAKHVRI